MTAKPVFGDNGEVYTSWLQDEREVAIEPYYPTHYEVVSDRARSDLLRSRLWDLFVEELEELNARYELERGFKLLPAESLAPEVKLKPYVSFLEKTYRKNILRNPRWPDPPEGDWLLPPYWFSQINDIVRTTISVRYLDGVKYVADTLGTIFDAAGAEHAVDFEAREEGYYAAHFLLNYEATLPQILWDTTVETMTFEIQIVTVVQEVIRGLLHTHYEQRRLLPEEPRSIWQWDYESAEFATNYLGHISHYLDGMIMGLREGKDAE